ncbi:MAG: acyl carrier protein [Thermodesulfobacteriota bacterium]
MMHFTREAIVDKLLQIFEENFEIENPGLDDDLRTEYNFDSLDAIEILVEIEKMLKIKLTQEEKKQAMDIRTINDICDYVQEIAGSRA